jgi:hypothetical protein
MSLFKAVITASSFKTLVLVNTNETHIHEASDEIIQWVRSKYPAGTMVDVSFVSHETMIDLHSAIAQGFESIKILD